MQDQLYEITVEKNHLSIYWQYLTNLLNLKHTNKGVSPCSSILKKYNIY